MNYQDFQTDSEKLRDVIEVLARSIDTRFRGVQFFVSDIWDKTGSEHIGFEVLLWDQVHRCKMVNDKRRTVKFRYNDKTIVKKLKENIQYI